MIHPSSVLWGIAYPVCKLRNPNTLADEETITLANHNRPPRILHEPVEYPRREARDGSLRADPRGFRVRISFDYHKLTAAEASEWAKIFNGFTAGYRLIMIPHYDDALKLEYDVLPDSGFQLGYIADKYLGHTGTFSFIGRVLIPAIDRRTSVNTFAPIVK